MITLFRSVARKRTVSILASVAVVSAAVANDYSVNFTSSAPTIDGSVDTIWASASPAATGFVDAGAPTVASTQQSAVRLLWDQSKLYVLFEMEDNEIFAAATADDAGFLFSAQDTAEIFLDPLLAQVAPTNNDKIYHISVDPGPAAYTWTEAGQNQTAWNLSDASEVAFSNNGTNWNIEMAIAWSDLNSTQTMSPGVVPSAPRDGVVWGLQLGRLHGAGSPPNNSAATKWNPTSGVFRNRPFGLMKFVGGPAAAPLSLTGKTIKYTNGFESPTYTAGSTVVGIDGWTSAAPATFLASSDLSKSGTQSLQAIAGTGAAMIGSKRSDNLSTAKYVQYAIHTPLDIPGNGYRHVAYFNGEYDNGLGGTQNGVAGSIWFNSNNTTGANSTLVYYYENPENEAEAKSIIFPGIQAYDTWTYITAKFNPVEKTYEIWFNDTKLIRPTGEDFFTVQKKSTFRQFTYNQFYNKSFGSTPIYIDEVVYADEPPQASVSDWQLF